MLIIFICICLNVAKAHLLLQKCLSCIIEANKSDSLGDFCDEISISRDETKLRLKWLVMKLKREVKLLITCAGSIE